jgi:hypothetical protein
VKAIAQKVLAHRVLVQNGGNGDKAKAEEIIEDILARTPTPGG